MNTERVNQDLVYLKKAGFRRKPTWKFNNLGLLSHIIIYGAIRLDQRFNLPDCNLLLPIPPNLYDPLLQSGRYQFYHYVFVDEKLQIFDPRLNGWRELSRGHPPRENPTHGGPVNSGWKWICVYNGTCGERENIMDMIASIQTYLYSDA
ncbi:hypothetical protein DYH09_25205 [bacterium CPR1]|nr:hypothetical protein [bacterium CPR1]